MNANKELKLRYERDGFVSPVRLFPLEKAAHHRAILEQAEAKIGNLHYKAKVHTILKSPWKLVSDSKVLDVVEQLLGPDIMIYSVEYIIKEPQTCSHVSWHQDLTYWGFSADDQVSMWLALSPATAESGCMRMVPGSHLTGKMAHQLQGDDNNILFQGQTVPDVDEAKAIHCPLEPGEASFHHGWVLHSSSPNRSNDRRIGLNVQYIRTSMRQLKQTGDTAVLVRGRDEYHHFESDLPAESDLDPEALARFKLLNKKYKEIVGSDTSPTE